MILMMKRILPLLLAAAALVSCGQVTVSTDRTEQWKALEGPLNFYLANDLGRNGYYDQKPIAETMGKMAETIDIEFVVAAGDIHHFEGVQSISDPLWMTNYKYYTFVKEEDGVTVRIVMVDTTPMIDKYREETDKYADASRSDWKEQTAWLDQVLSEADEDWVLVVGHHPIYAYTDKSESERTDLQQRLDPVIRKYGNVDMYLCGHIHTFQHIRKDGCDIDYVVNTSGSLSREDVQPTDGTVFCSNKSGWSLITADEHEMKLHMLDKEGNVLHTVTRTR